MDEALAAGHLLLQSRRVLGAAEGMSFQAILAWGLVLPPEPGGGHGQGGSAI